MLRMRYVATLFAVLAGVILVFGAVLYATGPTATSKDSTGSDGAAAPYGIVTKPILCASPWSLWTSPDGTASQNGACLISDDNRKGDANADLYFGILSASCSVMCFGIRRLSLRSIQEGRHSPVAS
jgi:hypothetical protein